MESNIIGTKEIMISVANQEILPTTPSHWSYDRYSFYKFSFINKADCRVQINGGSPILLEANEGIEISKDEKRVKSFVIIESNIPYKFIGAF